MDYLQTQFIKFLWQEIWAFFSVQRFFGVNFPAAPYKQRFGSWQFLFPLHVKMTLTFSTAFLRHLVGAQKGKRGPQVHNKFKSLTAKFKSITPNSNHLHRIQITYTEFKSLTPNSNHLHRIQITHTKLKSLTPNSNHSHQIWITHSKFKSLTPNSNHSHRIQITHTEFKFKSLTLNLKYSHRIWITYFEIKSLTLIF